MKNEILFDFISYLKLQDKADSTIKAYIKDVEQFLDFKKFKNIKDLNTEDLKEFSENLELNQGLAKKTLARKINSLRKFNKFLITKNITKKYWNVDIPKGKLKIPQIIPLTDCKKILNHSKKNERTNLIIEVVLSCGLKISEVAELELNSIGNGFVKTSNRTIKADQKLIEKLNKFIKNNKSNYVFETSNGKPMNVRNIRQEVDRILKRLGLEQFSINDLRNTFIVNQLRKEKDIEKVAYLAGHKSINSTSRYLYHLKN